MLVGREGLLIMMVFKCIVVGCPVPGLLEMVQIA